MSRCPKCAEPDPGELVGGGNVCLDCGFTWNLPPKKLVPFYNLQLDVLPIADFIAKYPTHNLMRRERWIIFEKIGYNCVHCGLQGTHVCWNQQAGGTRAQHWDLAGYNEDGKLIMLTRDHIQPKSKGGSNLISNYQTLCSPCNERKGNKT